MIISAMEPYIFLGVSGGAKISKMSFGYLGIEKRNLGKTMEIIAIYFTPEPQSRGMRYA